MAILISLLITFKIIKDEGSKEYYELSIAIDIIVFRDSHQTV